MDFRLFVDEFGNGDLDGAVRDPNVRYLALTGIIARQDTHRSLIEPAFEALKTRLFGVTTDIPIVFHRREIVRRQGIFSRLKDASAEAVFNAELLRMLTELPYRVITVQIDKKAHYEKYGVWKFDPYHYCFQCLVERYVLWLNYNGLRGDVMVEARSKRHDTRLKGSFQRLYQDGTENIPRYTVQARLSKKELHMKPKAANIAGLQMADLIVHPSARHMRFEREGLCQPDDFGSKVAGILVATRYRRNPSTLRIPGFGTKWLPE